MNRRALGDGGVLPKGGDEMKVARKTYGKGKGGSEVVLVVIEGGGHTRPGMKPPAGFMGKSAMTRRSGFPRGGGRVG